MRAKKLENSQKLGPMDAKDKIIFNALSKNAREKLTSLAKKAGLSIDSAKKRMLRLERLGVITKYTTQVDPAVYGHGFYVQVFIKFKSLQKERFDKLVSKLMYNKKIVSVFSMLGDYDFFFVYIGEGPEQFNSFGLELRHEFGDIIGEWSSVLITKNYKLEEYLV